MSVRSSSRRAPRTIRRSAHVIALTRRGVRHGRYRVAALDAVDLAAPRTTSDAMERWSRSEPVHLPGVLALAEHAPAIRSSRALFERLRTGASFQDELWRRVGARGMFEPAGVTIDLGDEREIEKVFAHARRGKRISARDLYAKLSWIAHDPRDRSLRVRFSFGSEHLLEWTLETQRAPWADRYAEVVFPECAVLTANVALVRLVEQLVGKSARFSERIVYSNAPRGGAVFHHDAEPNQLGVLYGQLAGETAWIALPKRELASEIAAVARGALRKSAGTPARALRALEEEDAPALARLLNETPSFTARLAERGALISMRAGDALLLPSHGPDDVAWHSVFALGREPSLAHSYGIFARRS